MTAIPLDMILWLSIGIFGIAVLMGIPIWWRNLLVRHGAQIPVTEWDLNYQAVARWLALVGILSTLSTVLGMASRVLPFAGFMVLCIGIGCAGIAAAFAIDAARARRH